MAAHVGFAPRAGWCAALLAVTIALSPVGAPAKTLNFAVSTFAEETFDPTMTSISAAVEVKKWAGVIRKAGLTLD